MEYTDYVGIDVSKKTLDVVIRRERSHEVFANDKAGMSKLLRWIKGKGVLAKSTLFCFEHTGIYSIPLSLRLAKEELRYVQLPGLAVKRSMGIKRGKSDRIDAIALAEHAYLHRETLKPGTPPDHALLKAKQLLSLRDRLVKQRGGHKANLKEASEVLGTRLNDPIMRVQKTLVTELSKHIKQLDQEITSLISDHLPFKENVELAMSVKGIGPQTALYMLITTENFTKFSSWRKYACYAGIAPFEHSSGTSIRGKTRVSHYANKQIKTLLSSAAASASLHNPEMRIYFKQRIAKGKHKMSTLNIIRNKLVSRVFAAVQRKRPYTITHDLAA